jgi:hypothetical protein
MVGKLTDGHSPFNSYPTTLHTFDETQRCQLYHHYVVVIQLAALGFITQVTQNPKI